MISICCCSINSKFETEIFIRALNYHNRDNLNFEICLTHDNRVEDGSAEYFEALQKEFPNLKIITNTDQDTINYLHQVIEYYDFYNMFSVDFRNKLKLNLSLYKAGELLNPSNSFLWLTSSLLYNKAVSISTGDILLITPADYLFTFMIGDLESHVIEFRDQSGLFYGKFNGLANCLSNDTPDNIIDHLPIGDGHISRIYTRYPPTLDNHYFIDHNSQSLVQLSDSGFLQKVITSVENLRDNPKIFTPIVHGLHVMTRQMYDIIGGFSEEFYGRAWQDCKMNSLAMRLFWREGSQLPASFSFLWTPQGVFRELDCDSDIEEIDNYHEKHPIAGRRGPLAAYLHEGYGVDFEENINSCLDKEFSISGVPGRLCPPVRIATR